MIQAIVPPATSINFSHTLTLTHPPPTTHSLTYYTPPPPHSQPPQHQVAVWPQQHLVYAAAPQLVNENLRGAGFSRVQQALRDEQGAVTQGTVTQGTVIHSSQTVQAQSDLCYKNM